MNRKNQTLSLWRNKSYLFLISSQIVSSIGDWLDMLALLTLVGVKWDASAIEMTGLMLCLSGPMILFGSLAGVFADKYNRKILMIIADILRFAVVIGIIFASQLWQIYILLFIKSSFAALFIPAKNGKLKEIVSDDNMQKAMGISGMIDNGAKIVGPMFSGVLVAFLGSYAAFYIDAGSFLASALFLTGVTSKSLALKQENNVQKSKQHFIAQLMDGLSTIKTIPSLLLGLSLISFILMALQIADTQAIVLLRKIPHQPVGLLGYSMAASGAGMFIASAILTKKKLHSVLKLIILASITMGLGFIASTIILPFPLVILMVLYPIIFLIIGFSFGIAIIPFNIDAQKKTPVEYSGRVFGTINSVTTAAVLIGMVLGGTLAQLFGVIIAFIISGLSLILIGFIFYIKTRMIKGSEQHGTKSFKGIQG